MIPSEVTVVDCTVANTGRVRVWPVKTRNGELNRRLILYAIGQLGVAGAAGHAVEFAGPVVRALPMEARFTLCNLAVEMGARYAIIAPDDTTFAYLTGRRYAPTGAA